MSLSAIQDNLLKTNLVQQTQTKGDDVVRAQETASIAGQKEENRRQDEVVLSTRESEQGNVRSDERGGNGRDDRKRERREREEDGDDEEDTGPRARMRRINIVI